MNNEIFNKAIYYLTVDYSKKLIYTQTIYYGGKNKPSFSRWLRCQEQRSMHTSSQT